MELVGVDESGLTPDHYAYLRCLDTRQGQAGLKTICTSLRQNEATVLELERLLESLRLVTFSDRGRQLTPAGMSKARTLRSAA